MDEQLAKTGFFYRLRYLASSYFRSEERASAWGLLTVNVLMVLVIVAVSYALTVWNGTFFDAMQKYDVPEIWRLFAIYIGLAAVVVVANTLSQYLVQIFQIRWRRWLTRRMVNDWMARQTHYRMQLDDRRIDNPDQRISDDVDFFTGQTVNLPLSALQSVVTIASYSFMLWDLSRNLRLFGLYVPGLLLWMNLIYAIGGTILMLIIGRPLFFLNNVQQQAMGTFRFELIRVRDNSETIATAHSGPSEATRLKETFRPVVDIFYRRIYRTVLVNTFGFSFNTLGSLLGFALVIPSYLAKRILIGTVSQTNNAFGQMQQAFGFIINNFSSIGSGYLSITEWRAVIDRLYTMEVSLRHHQVEEVAPGIVYDRSADNSLAIARLSLALPDRRSILEGLDIDIAPGDRILISGPTGAGKSTLIRAIAGIWPFGSGRISAPAGRTLFVPQRPYLPNGTLIQSLAFPYGQPLDGGEVADLLGTMGLGRLIAKLETVEPWDRELSPGEQQRIAFARCVLLRPDVIILDEATSALDEDYEALMYRTLTTALPHATIISVGHRSTIVKYHTRRLRLLGDGGWRDEVIAPAPEAVG
ncbi:MAG: ABC transporter ATP-binding protein/permease [Acidiphilium sp.]|nr:ABC transporter ATP-binding protein/permease [Acidiphilium sp.]